MKNFKLWFKQNSPEILLTTSIVGTTSAVALGCIATPKAINIVKRAKGDKKKLDKSAETTKKEVRKLYAKTGLKLALTYLPCAVAYGVSIGCSLGSHKIMRNRLVSLSAALATCTAGFEAYRSRVREQLGEEAEKALFEGKSSKEGSEKDSKNTTSKSYDMKDLHTDCDFGVVWGEGNYEYDHDNPSLNLTKLLQVEKYLNDKFEAQGYLFLYDVYEGLGYTNGMLGERKLQASRVLGWILDPEDKTRDNYISFGLHDKNGELTPEAKRLQLGTENAIWLEFNVDGDILTGNKGKKTFMATAVKKG